MIFSNKFTIFKNLLKRKKKIYYYTTTMELLYYTTIVDTIRKFTQVQGALIIFENQHSNLKISGHVYLVNSFNIGYVTL